MCILSLTGFSFPFVFQLKCWLDWFLDCKNFSFGDSNSLVIKHLIINPQRVEEVDPYLPQSFLRVSDDKEPD